MPRTKWGCAPGALARQGGKGLWLCVLVVCLRAPAWAQQPAGIDRSKAQAAFAETRTLSDRDAGRLWGKPLYGPMLFVVPETHEVVANEPDAEGKLHVDGGVYAGVLPRDMILANTATEWAGKRWTMVQWPLPDGLTSRERLLLHECFHRIQPEIGLRLSNPQNAQLDTLDGRLWLQLEWRALAVALLSEGVAQRQAISDALLFRRERLRRFPAAAATERALEDNEGLAEYTGVRLSAPDTASARWRAAQRLVAPDSSTFVRSFAYTAGPAYGLLLDQFQPGWRTGLAADADLPRMLGQHAGRAAPGDATERALRYGAATLRLAETERDAVSQARQAQFRALLLNGATLRLTDAGHFQFGFDPNNLVPMGSEGTVYPTMQVTDVWGALEVREGALLTPDYKRVTVAAPAKVEAQRAEGPGWILTLSAGWAVVPDPARPGSFTLAKTAP